MKKALAAGGLCLLLAGGGDAMQSGDAYIRREGNRWAMGTATVERTVAMENGRLLLTRCLDRRSGRELLARDTASEEFAFGVGDGGERITSGSGDWTLVASEERELEQGELELDVTVARQGIRVTKSYVVHPHSSVIREWLTIRNAGDKPVRIVEPAFLRLLSHTGEPDSRDFHWMTGGESQPGSWALKTEKLTAGKQRKFDSYEPLLVDKSAVFPGDGVDAKITLNGRPVWPGDGWIHTANATMRVPFSFSVDVKAGDELAFLTNMHGNIGWDTTEFDPTITYADGESHTAGKEFGKGQGANGWRYQYLEKGQYVDLVYYPQHNQWRKAVDNATGTPFVGASNQHPDSGQDAARVWTAPRDGSVRITGSVCNTGNGGGINASYGFRPGTSTYAPWYALYSRDSKTGLFIGWDYFGHWASSFDVQPDGAVATELRVAGHKQTLAPGESLETPKAFVGLFQNDLDEAGNECLDWQYRYMWDYTRDGWFPAIRMLGYWYKGTGWGQVGWTGGKPDMESTFRKVFRVADLMRYTGADVYHRDWGWWDRAGDWNGPDFRATGDYLRKSGMGQLIYAFLYTVDTESKVAKEHPDWLIGGNLDPSKPEVVDFMLGQLDDFAKRWGDFEWRNDSFFTAPRDGDDTCMLAQDHGLRRLFRDFLDKHPGCAFQAVNGGGNYTGYDYVRYSSCIQMTDGGVGILSNYYNTLLLPPDKMCHMPDSWDPAAYDKSTWRGLLSLCFDLTGDTWDPAKLERLRELIDIYHYLHSQGVVGRWVKVYRPAVTGDDPTMYFQRLSGDRKRGIVITKHAAPGPVTIRPKGLLPEETYDVSFHESDGGEKRTGVDLMAKGISFDKLPPGELIYLNLPLHPGSKLDKEPPSPPTGALVRAGENMGYPGVEITWKPGKDNNWVSHYEILRDGKVIDKVAKGAYYFDHSAGADPAATYEVRTVDGAGNVPATVSGTAAIANRAAVIDDAPRGGITFTGDWKHETGLLPAHEGTISRSNSKGAAAEFECAGRKLLVFGKLGDNCGRAAVSIDGGAAEIIDTYSADDIWGVCVYRKDLGAGRHRVRIGVLGERGERAKDAFVYIDGARIEQ